jgi:hypothetical protein
MDCLGLSSLSQAVLREQKERVCIGLGDIQHFNKSLTESHAGAGNPKIFYDFRTPIWSLVNSHWSLATDKLVSLMISSD